ncbi:hypothetical protein BDR06DRAFT_1025773 [Suillus hirtellus]|nr:hypothetical protein BDR06DRAFT_1025773 [Suillus hirtellus]
MSQARILDFPLFLYLGHRSDEYVFMVTRDNITPQCTRSLPPILRGVPILKDLNFGLSASRSRCMFHRANTSKVTGGDPMIDG